MNTGYLWAVLALASLLSTIRDIKAYRAATPGKRGFEVFNLVLDSVTLPCLTFLTVAELL